MATYFTDQEIQGLDRELIAKLDLARHTAGIPFFITSGLRTCAANTAAMGVENSSHILGLAVDLRCHDSVSRFLMVKALLGAGFVRIGVYGEDGHLHVDADASKPQNVIWVGK